MKLNYKEILIFDFETTGLSPMQDKVIEVGAVLVEKHEDTFIIKKEINYLIKQREPISQFITNLTGITNDMLESTGVDEEFAFNELNALIHEDTLLVAYNLNFDIGFLLKLYQMYYDRKYMIKNDILDCMAVYKDRYEYPHKLSDAVERFKLTNDQAHRASEDAKATFQVLLKLSEELDNMDKYVNVLGFNPKYRQPDTYFFKKPIKLIAQGFKGFREIEKSK